MDKAYPTDLTDDQWAVVRPLLPPARRGGRPRTTDLRLVLNTIFYLNKAGCQWAMLPKGLAKRSTAFDYFAAWKSDGAWQAILDALRRQDGRKRHLIVDSLGLLLVALVTSANLDDGATAPRVFERLTPEQRSRLDEIRGDGKYNNRTLDRYLARTKAACKITVVERPKGVKGLVQLPYRWVIERTNAWTGKYRRNSKDYERTTASAEAMVQASMIHLMLRRLKPDASAQKADFHYPRKPLQKAA